MTDCHLTFAKPNHNRIEGRNRLLWAILKGWNTSEHNGVQKDGQTEHRHSRTGDFPRRLRNNWDSGRTHHIIAFTDSGVRNPLWFINPQPA
ncbi:hypothetical protein BLNAU_20120 [Blattamonas nauphoetae]|uniref:Transposase n=1 Tax=Blattamonas nauphoetae TaxID=2049346 RepID=A0ABQ9WZK1_9EUKA|nr:hypothetical protein BLNAU_20120 [Blattamonas nauphoetae]